MTTFIAIYRGDAPSRATLVAATSDPAIVSDVARQILDKTESTDQINDPVVEVLQNGRKHALRLIGALNAK